jgi:hypothetical protein
MSIAIKKSLLCEAVTLDSGRFAPTSNRVSSSDRVRCNIERDPVCLFLAGILASGFTSSTLVLESHAADFSTEAGNSDLIVLDEISSRSAS